MTQPCIKIPQVDEPDVLYTAFERIILPVCCTTIGTVWQIPHIQYYLAKTMDHTYSFHSHTAVTWTVNLPFRLESLHKI